MNRRILSMMAPFIALAGGYPEMRPLVSVQCPGCGMALAGIDAEAGHTRCRECRANGEIVIGVDHGAGPAVSATVLMRRTEAGYTVVCAHRKPIEVVCPTCKAAPGEACDRRTMGRKWLYHRARVDAAGGGR